MAAGILQEMTIDEVRAFKAEVVVVGVGSTEPHGPALPYGTDFFQADATIRRGVEFANQRGARAIMYPTLPVGNNVNFRAWPLACRISVRTLMQMLLDIIQALYEDGIRKVVLFNGHGGNTDTLRATLRASFEQYPVGQVPFVCLTSGFGADIERGEVVEHPSDHGGESETSRVMHLRPELVKADKLANNPWGELAVESLNDPEIYFVRPWHLHVPASAGGEARKSSAEKGRKLIDLAADGLARLLVDLTKTPWSENFPFKKGG